MKTFYVCIILIMAMFSIVYAYKALKYHKIYDNGADALCRAKTIEAVKSVKTLRKKAAVTAFLFYSAFEFAFGLGFVAFVKLCQAIWG